MPELPEVETIKLQLEEKIKGKKIKEVEVRLPKLINISVKEFKEKTEGAKVENIRRRAKLLIIDLDNNFSLIIHLKLTGQLIYQEEKKGVGKPHLIFTFLDGTKLFHFDLRQFGFIKLIETKKIEDFLEKEKFGPEPLEKEFDLELFKSLLQKKKKQKIKPLLMDQTFIAGIGNVYAQEICFFAKVLPTRKVETLKEEEIKKIFEGIKKILPEAIKHQGSSVDTYLTLEGEKGKYIPFLKVYDRENQPCFRCKAKIKKIVLGGRGTYYCSNCQR